MIEPTASGLLRLIAADDWMMDVLRTAAAQHLPDWWIGAGFVRGKVWDVLHGFDRRSELADVDVLYFDRGDLDKRREAAIEQALRAERPDVAWSVRNQARMHLKNGDPPYRDTEDAMRYWLETPTCVAVSLDAAEELRLIAPYGLDDLFDLVVRPTPAGRRRHDAYMDRLRRKNWQRQWPRMTFEAAP